MRARGFTYLAVLFVIAIMGAGLALAGEVWQTVTLREKEAELLFVGNQYRKAIERYYLNGANQYPRNLPDLLKDPRKATTERYLRRLYPDPITGNAEWGIVKAPDGGIMGVNSTSDDKPLKTTGFRPRDRAFEGIAKYSGWSFVYTPGVVAGPAADPGAAPAAAPDAAPGAAPAPDPEKPPAGK